MVHAHPSPEGAPTVACAYLRAHLPEQPNDPQVLTPLVDRAAVAPTLQRSYRRVGETVGTLASNPTQAGGEARADALPRTEGAAASAVAHGPART